MHLNKTIIIITIMIATTIINNNIIFTTDFIIFNLFYKDSSSENQYTPTLRYRGCYVTDVFAYLVISSVLRALVVFYIRDPTTLT